MEGIQVISTSTIQAPSQNSNFTPKIDLTPWDLQFLPFEAIQQGLLFQAPRTKDIYIHLIKDTLTSTLDFFIPLAGRLAIVDHIDNTSSVFINCNNAGALFVHAKADNTFVSDILGPAYVPRIVHSMFPLVGVKNYEGTSKPLFAVQVTELVDGIFIGCSINHCVVDGMSFYQFINSWIEISRGSHKVPKPPVLERWFLEGTDRPIRFPFKRDSDGFAPQIPPERIFHFTKGRLDELKAKANAEVSTNNISSLQALLSHVWRSVVRNQHLHPQKDVAFVLVIDARSRILHPPLAESYFGNALHVSKVTMKAGDLLEGGVGKAAWEMNKTVSLHTEEKLKSYYESWVKEPQLFTVSSMTGNALATSGSPKFEIHGNDFGVPLMGIRCGPSNKANGKLTVLPGAEKGSIDIEVCLQYEILEAMAKDPEFMDVVSI